MESDPPEVRICEGLLLEELKSPSSYKRVEVNRFSEQIEFEEAFRKIYPDSQGSWRDYAESIHPDFQFIAESMARHWTGPTYIEVYLEYDADNSYGASIRGLTSCDFLVPNADEDVSGATFIETKVRYFASKRTF